MRKKRRIEKGSNAKVSELSGIAPSKERDSSSQPWEERCRAASGDPLSGPAMSKMKRQPCRAVTDWARRVNNGAVAMVRGCTLNGGSQWRCCFVAVGLGVGKAKISWLGRISRCGLCRRCHRFFLDGICALLPRLRALLLRSR